jgi:hypothetical protein
MNTITLAALFTDRQLRDLTRMWRQNRADFHRDATAYLEAIMPQINERTAQENDAAYWAYALEYAFVFAEGTRH